MVAGKTVTQLMDGKNFSVTAEMGTCYSHLGHVPMFKDLHDIMINNSLQVMEDTGVVTTKQFSEDGPVMLLFKNKMLPGVAMQGNTFPTTIFYANYMVLKAFEDTTITPNSVNKESLVQLVKQLPKTLIKIIAAAVKYGFMHYLYFGSERPVTTRPRERFLNDVGNTTILQFLKNYKLEALIGIFHYAHTTMGYGAIERVSSVYLLIWVCPE